MIGSVGGGGGRAQGAGSWILWENYKEKKI